MLAILAKLLPYRVPLAVGPNYTIPIIVGIAIIAVAAVAATDHSEEVNRAVHRSPL